MQGLREAITAPCTPKRCSLQCQGGQHWAWDAVRLWGSQGRWEPSTAAAPHCLFRTCPTVPAALCPQPLYQSFRLGLRAGRAQLMSPQPRCVFGGGGVGAGEGKYSGRRALHPGSLRWRFACQRKGVQCWAAKHLTNVCSTRK